MSIQKLKTGFFGGAWINDVKSYFTKINEIIDVVNDIPEEPFIKVSLTALQVQTLESSPVDSGIDIPAAGKVIIVKSAFVNLKFNTTIPAFSQLEIGLQDRSGAQYLWEANDTQNVFSPALPTSINGNPIKEGEGLFISSNLDGAGDSEIDVYIYYQILTL